MEINITSLANLNCFDLSRSIAEAGPNAGPQSWQNAKEQAEETPLLNDAEKLQAFRDWIKDFGAWDAEEIAAMSDNDLNALFLQWVAGDTRKAGADSLAEIDWLEYEKQAETGQVSSNLFKDENGEIYFSLNH
jgi:hypothetical protein